MSKRWFAFLVCLLSILLFSSLAVADKNESIYEISGRVKLENMVNMQMSIVIHYFDPNNQLVGQYGMDYKQNTMDWVKLSGILNVPTNATTARIHFHMNSTGEHGKGTAYVDDTALVFVGS
ncbi:hypothetical protein AMQ83_23840 [Paenibacillus riograndensis]|nr:hypothetical protein AMQ83_23840 [Paenibacillus riograndensis]